MLGPPGECLTPLVLNPLVAERAFPTSDYWGRTGSARCAEEMTVRDGETTIKNKICGFEGGGAVGDKEESRPKRSFSWETPRQ